MLRGPQLGLIPISVFLYLAGRASFAINYAKGAVARSFGMALTGGPIFLGYVLAGAPMVTGR